MWALVSAGCTVTSEFTNLVEKVFQVYLPLDLDFHAYLHILMCKQIDLFACSLVNVIGICTFVGLSFKVKTKLQI